MAPKKSPAKPRRSNPFAGSSGKVLDKRSSVWQFFELNRQTRRAQCRSCEKILAYTGGTTNLRYHLTAAHEMPEFEVSGPSAKVFKNGKPIPRKPYKKRLPQKKIKTEKRDMASPFISTPTQASTSSVFTATRDPEGTSDEAPATPPSVSRVVSQTQMSGFLKKRFIVQGSRNESDGGMITEQILQMMIKGLQSLEFVTSEGFTGYTSFLEPAYQMPKAESFQRRILGLHEQCKFKLRDTLAKEATHFSVVYDVWKGSDQEAYVTITVQYLTSNWESRSYVLGTNHLTQHKANGPEICQHIRTLLLQYDLPPERLVAVICRQGMLRVQTERVGVMLSCESMSCAAEKLELCVQTAFVIPEVRKLIEQVGQTVNYLINDEEASKLMQEFRDTDSYYKLNPTIELVEGDGGSWITKADMLIQFVELRPLIEKVNDYDTTIKADETCLSTDQWELAEMLANSLQILKAALTVLSKAKTGSVSCLLPVVHSILQHCEDANHDRDSAIDKFLKAIGKEVREKWDLTAILPSSVPMLAAMLDPRFKKLKFIAEEDKVDVFDALKGVAASNAGDESAGGSGSTAESTDATPFLCLFGGAEEYAQDKQDVDSEISNYVGFPALRHDSCPLDWWRVNKGRFPQLAEVARQFLSLPAIAQPVDDVTSGLSRRDMKRALLEKVVAGPLIFLNQNLSLLQR